MPATNIFSNLLNILKKHGGMIVLLVILIAHLFFRFYLLEERMGFGWDQVDNAWAAKDILVDGRHHLVGMVAKGNSGFNIGPLYYYFISGVYWILGLNPIASPVIAGLTSIFTFFILYFITKKLFSNNIALIVVGIHTISSFIIASDRTQWPVNFIAPISFVIFYSLYNVLLGKVKYLLLLALAMGFSFHIHFTSVFYPIIILLALPFFPRKIQTLKYILISIPVFLVFLVPNVVAQLTSKHSYSNSLFSYVDTYYQGFHFTRVLQLTHDAFVEFQLILRGWLHDINYLLVVAFFIVYWVVKPSWDKFYMSYLIALWFIVPWFVFATYSGEISNYYFYMTRPIAILILAYLTYRVFNIKNLLPKLLVIVFGLYFSYVNIVDFFNVGPGNFSQSVSNAKSAISKGEFIDAYPYIPESYLYYYYTKVIPDKK